MLVRISAALLRLILRGLPLVLCAKAPHLPCDRASSGLRSKKIATATAPTSLALRLRFKKSLRDTAPLIAASAIFFAFKFVAPRLALHHKSPKSLHDTLLLTIAAVAAPRHKSLKSLHDTLLLTAPSAIF